MHRRPRKTDIIKTKKENLSRVLLLNDLRNPDHYESHLFLFTRSLFGEFRIFWQAEPRIMLLMNDVFLETKYVFIDRTLILNRKLRKIVSKYRNLFLAVKTSSIACYKLNLKTELCTGCYTKYCLYFHKKLTLKYFHQSRMWTYEGVLQICHHIQSS